MERGTGVETPNFRSARSTMEKAIREIRSHSRMTYDEINLGLTMIMPGRIKRPKVRTFSKVVETAPPRLQPNHRYRSSHLHWNNWWYHALMWHPRNILQAETRKEGLSSWLGHTILLCKTDHLLIVTDNIWQQWTSNDPNIWLGWRIIATYNGHQHITIL